MFPMLPKCRCHFGGRGFWYFICCTPRCTNHVKNACTGFTVDISSICKRVNKYQISNFPSYEWISKSALGRQSQDLQIDTAPEISFGMCAFLWCRSRRSENEKGICYDAWMLMWNCCILFSNIKFYLLWRTMQSFSGILFEVPVPLKSNKDNIRLSLVLWHLKDFERRKTPQKVINYLSGLITSNGTHHPPNKAQS